MSAVAIVLLLAYRVFGDVGGSGAASHVTAGAVLTLVVPLALLVIVLTWWWLAARRGWPPLPTAKRSPAAGDGSHLQHRDD